MPFLMITIVLKLDGKCEYGYSAPLPLGHSPIAWKWVFKGKLNPNGTIACNKAWLVTHDFSQVEGLDYLEMFSPVIRMASFQLFMDLTTIFYLEIHCFYVQTAFLHGNFLEGISMAQPFGSKSNSQSNYVCRIHQSLSYRVKQSPRLWFKKFNSFMLTQAYSPSLPLPHGLIHINQQSYVESLLKKYNISTCRGVLTPLPISLKPKTQPHHQQWP